MLHFQDKVSFIWSIAELLRGDYKQSDYGKVILPLTVMRRLDCVLEPTKDAVLAKHASLKALNMANVEPILNREAGQSFHNTSRFTFQKLKDEPEKIAPNLIHYLQGFSAKAREILEKFEFEAQIAKLDAADLLYQVVLRFIEIDLHPEIVSNLEMGYIFEELIRRFSEQSNETAGEHFTPREVIRLMVDLLFVEDGATLTRKGIVRTLYDPACGTGGMLSVAEEYLHEMNPDARLEVFGQELNAESYAICNSDMMLKGQNPDNIKFGNSFTADGLRGQRFDYMLSNPPFGVDWKKAENAIRAEAETQGHAGRFGAGLPRINDGSFLFLQHMISKMKPESEGSRLAIVFNGSPLFTGDAGSGESEIRRWILENDWLEAIVALPAQLFYNTGINTYVWIVSNRKPAQRKGKVQLINAVDCYQKMRKSLGEKRKELSEQHIAEITQIFGDFDSSEQSKIFANEDFGYYRITVERPLRLNFQASPERVALLWAQSAFRGLADTKKKGVAGAQDAVMGQALQLAIFKVLETLDPKRLYRDRSTFEADLETAFKRAGMKLPAPLRKAILAALSEKDEAAEICRDPKGNPEPDPDLRDFENVPLGESIEAYFAREVVPHVPDAWIDESKTKVGYEIPFTRHFYQYKALRPLEEIDAEIRAAEADIVRLLQDVLA